MTSNFNLLKYAATGIAAPDMTYIDKMRASTLMGGVVQTLTGIPPLSFKSDGSPLISWSMKGNGSQSGTPTPDNPVMPEFVGVRTGNLHNPETDVFGFINPNGDISSSSITKSTDFILCKSGSQYVLRVYKTGTLQSTNMRTVDFYASDKSYIDVGWTNRVTYVLNGDEEYLDIPFVVPTGARFLRFSYDIGYSKIMLNPGSTPLPYEPYGWAEKITCAGQTTPVYLGEVPTVRRVKKLVLDGTETYAKQGNGTLYSYNLLGSEKAQARDLIKCSHLPFSWNYSTTISVHIYSSLAVIFLNFGPDIMNAQPSGNTVAGLKEYLAAQYAAGTPVTFWYVLNTEQTGIVNEPLCKIGDYADELSSTDAGVSIPTVKGSNTLTVDTPIQPSEMTITFKG